MDDYEFYSESEEETVKWKISKGLILSKQSDTRYLCDSAPPNVHVLEHFIQEALEHTG